LHHFQIVVFLAPTFLPRYRVLDNYQVAWKIHANGKSRSAADHVYLSLQEAGFDSMTIGSIKSGMVKGDAGQNGPYKG
jgi:hypothetical protein